MKNEKQTKKQKHAAKPWGFPFRGGINGIDVAEIAETLSRNSPIAVVTLMPKNKGLHKDVIIVVHHSLLAKCRWVCGASLRDYLTIDSSLFTTKVVENDMFAYIPMCGNDALTMTPMVLKSLEFLKNHNLPDKREYTAAVNYPKV